MLKRVSILVIFLSAIGCGPSSGSGSKKSGSAAVNTSIAEAELLSADYSELMLQTKLATDFLNDDLETNTLDGPLSASISENCEVSSSESDSMLKIVIDNGPGPGPIRYSNTSLVTSNDSNTVSARNTVSYRLVDQTLRSQYELQNHSCTNEFSVRQTSENNTSMTVSVSCTTNTRTLGSFKTTARVQSQTQDDVVSISSSGTIEHGNKVMSFSVSLVNGLQATVKVNGQDASSLDPDALSGLWQGAF
ncbi:MAG: hypothetical protein HRT45_15135 [Bdellovibrionales bacterium]|nr:hypothetical protein [Bdellovibrionales bacterium]